MNGKRTRKRSAIIPVTALAVTVFLLIGWGIESSKAQVQSSISEELSKALDMHLVGDFDKGIARASALLERSGLAAQDSIAIYEVLSVIYYSKGEDFYKKSKEYLEKICTVGPCRTQLPREFWPMGLRKSWYAISEQHDRLVCPPSDTLPLEIKTVAVRHFDNASVAEYQQSLGALGLGLATFFLNEFQKVSSLKIVERDKLDYILQEHLGVKEGLIDQETAVRAGKILGAHLMVFGSFSQIDKNQTVITLRAVNVETSEIMASVSEAGKPKYFDLVKTLVKRLCDEVDVKLTDDDEKKIESGGTESFDATTHYARGLEFEDQYDYAAAYREFKKAYEIDGKFEEAKRKMEIYRPLAG
jgi:hypothetical protein